MSKVKLIWLILFLIQITNECHYTCLTCQDSSYSKCSTCPYNQELHKLQGYENQANGICKLIQIGYYNIVGLLLLIFTISSTIVFPHEEIFHFVLFLQSISLLYIYDILWSSSTDFMLGSFTFLMPFLKISQLYSKKIPKINSYKPRLFFNNSFIESQGSAIAIINLLIILMMIIIPIFRSIRRKINKQRPNCLPQPLLGKTMLVLYGCYLFLIQQSVLSIYFGYSQGNFTQLGLVISILYFFSLIFFLFNLRYFQLPMFRNKCVQLNIVFVKIISPIFIVAQGQYQFFGLIILFLFYLIDMIITNKKKPNVSFNRLLLYKIYGLGVIIFLLVNFITEFTVNSEKISKIFGTISSVLFGGQLYFYLLQFVICFKQNYCINQVKDKRSVIQITKQNMVSIKDDSYQYDLGEVPNEGTNQTLGNFDKNQSLVVHKSKEDEEHIVEIIKQNSQKENENASEDQANMKIVLQKSIILSQKIDQTEKKSKQRQYSYQRGLQKDLQTYAIQIQSSSAQISNMEKSRDSAQRIRRKRKNKA